MPWLGVEKGSVDEEEFSRSLEQLGFKVYEVYDVKVRSTRGWLSFTTVEVSGFVETLSQILCQRFRAPALEGGEHLILGEASAKLWNEAVKIVFPDGMSEIVPVYTHDGFLDLRMPTSDCEGLKGYMEISGRKFELPLKIEDLPSIHYLGKPAIERIDRAVSAYGAERILSEEVIKRLKVEQEMREEAQEEVDYETGFVLSVKKGRISTQPIHEYIVETIVNNRGERALEVYQRAPEQLKEQVAQTLIQKYELYLGLGKKKEADLIHRFCENAKLKI